MKRSPHDEMTDARGESGGYAGQGAEAAVLAGSGRSAGFAGERLLRLCPDTWTVPADIEEVRLLVGAL
jgi:hypothetical protein